jgi:hypothetical protein
MGECMSAPPVTRLLLRARDAGITVRVDRGDLVVWPTRALTPELREELLRHKPDLLKALTWRESDAHALLQDAIAYLSEFYVGGLDAHEDAVNDAFHERDMFALRIAVREWVQARVAAYKARERDRGAA